MPSRVRDSPAKPTGGESRRANGRRTAPSSTTRARRGASATCSRRAARGRRRPWKRGSRAGRGPPAYARPAPARLRGDGGVQQAAGRFRRGDPKGGGTINENGRRAVAPSEGARATERGWVFPPADDPHSKRGASERGCRGKTKAGETAAPPPPRRAKIKPTGRASRREAARGTTARPQPRRERDNASSRWRGPWVRLFCGGTESFSPRLDDAAFTKPKAWLAPKWSKTIVKTAFSAHKSRF